jgi:ligand-binding sensor domain-containing protein
MKKILQILTVFVLIANSLYGQSYNFENFSVREDLAQSQILSICQDSKGYLWFGTNSGGACKYDGTKFLSLTENDGLVNNVVFSITELKDHTLAFGTNGGLSLYNGQHFINYTEKEGLPHSRIFKTIVDKKGILWIATSKGVCQLVEGKIVPFSADSLLNEAGVFTIYEDQKNNLWFGSVQNGVIKYIPEKKQFIHFRVSPSKENSFIRAIVEDEKHNMYVGTNNGIYMINPAGKVSSLPVPHHESIAFTCATKDVDNNIWLGSSEGIFKYHDGLLKSYNEKNGLPANNIFSLLIDRENSLWFGSDGNGVSKFAGEAFSSYTAKDGLKSADVTCIFEDSKNNTWIGTRSNGLFRITNHQLIGINSLSDEKIFSITEDDKGTLYVGTGNGLALFDGVTFRNYHPGNSASGNTVFSIIKNLHGRILVASRAGLSYFENKSFKPVKQVDSLLSKGSSKAIYLIFEDAQSNLWLKCEDGLIKYDQKNVKLYTESAELNPKSISSIAADKYGNLWFATSKGLVRYNNDTFSNLKQKNGLQSDKIYALLPDEGDLWLGTNKGLDRLDLAEYQKRGAIKIRHYGKHEGFLGVECNSNAVARDRTGSLWFGTVDGIYIFDPLKEKVNTHEPLTHLTSIELFFEIPEWSLYSKSVDGDGLPENLTLPFDKNHLSFNFIGLSLKAPQKVKYKYWLKGFEDSWQPEISSTKVVYSNIPPGNYEFLLMACNNDGIWNQTPISMRFKITPPFWKSWWFYLLCSGIIASGIYSYLKIRASNKEIKKQKHLVEIQKHLLEEKNKDITDSLNYAKRIQGSLLPHEKYIDRQLKRLQNRNKAD